MPLMQRLSGTHGVWPVCRELDIAPSTYYWHQQHRRHPEKWIDTDRRFQTGLKYRLTTSSQPSSHSTTSLE